MKVRLIVLLLAALPLLAQPCEISNQLKAAQEAAFKPGAPVEERLAAARKIRDQFPQDYFAHRAYQALSWSRGVASPEMRAEYKALMDSHPGDPLYATLYARVMTGFKTPEAIEILNGVLAKDPTYPYANQKLTEIYTSQVFRDDRKFQTYMLAYRQACPKSLSAYVIVGNIDDPAFLQQTASALRGLIEHSTARQDLLAYRTLWNVEFKAAPLVEHAKVRDRVRADAARLRAMDIAGDDALLPVLGQAYAILGDKDGAKWVAERRPKTSSAGGPSPIMQAMSEWRQANPRKPGSDYQEYQARLARQADEWIRQQPDDPQAYAEKFNAISFVQDIPIEEIVPVGEEWIRVYEKHPVGMSPYLSVARFYSQKSMRYAELPGLLEKALQNVKEPPLPLLSDLYRPASLNGANTMKWSTWSGAADIYIKIKQYDKARDLLAKLGPSLADAKPPDSATENETRMYKEFTYSYWSAMARLAHGEDHKLDELAFQRNADMTTPFSMSAEAREYRIAQQRALWISLGGTGTGFDAWMNPPSAPAKAPSPAKETAPPVARPVVVNKAEQWTTLNKPLPDFRLSDAAGKAWTLDDLKGKVTLINLWATWCSPCRNELPFLQKLFDKLRGRKDIQVLTLNTDDEPSPIMPFLDTNKYTFPVLPAAAYVRRLVPELSIPRNWIVDAQGVLRQERIGFGPGDDNWIDEMIAALEKSR